MRMLMAVLGMTCLLLAGEEPRQKIHVDHTERAELPAGGLLRFRNSTGELTVEGWDRPDVEIATVKWTKAEYQPRDREKGLRELEQVRISVERRGDELVVTTDFPRHRGLPPSSIVRPATNFDLEYHVKVPRNARLAIDHDTGEVHIDNMASDIDVAVLKGALTLHLPQENAYSIDAKSDFGEVYSDFPGRKIRAHWLLGHQFVQPTAAAHKLHLRVGFGDITILKIAVPSTPGPLTH